MIYSKPFEYGPPDDTSKTHYGLYQPVLDRLIFTLDDKEIALEIKKIMSSRFGLFVFDLNTADNYNHTLLDNTCCENWTISNKKDINVTHSYLDTLVLPTETILPVDSTCDWPLEPEKEWMQAIWYWTRFRYQMERIFYPWYHVEQFVDEILPIDSDSHYKSLSEFGTLIRSLFYLERDYDLVISKIESAIDSSIILTKGYERWIEGFST